MAQEFKLYDQKYKIHAGTALKQIVAESGSVAKSDIEEFDHWNQGSWGVYCIYPREKVEWAVYHAEGHEDWQKWRVSMKGLSTKEKLFCLAAYYVRHMSGSAREILLMKIRVNNYLGALIRGGQLNSHLEVKK